MKIKTILKITNGTIINDCKEVSKIRQIQIDSRKVKKNDLFIAMKGKFQNGHDFIDDAIANGAKAIICEEDVEVTDVPLIKVESSLNALASLALANRIKYKDIPLIAVTGSCGKTTTKELISTILSKKYRVLKNLGNYNNHLGLPQTLLKLNNSYDVAVCELGMNHPGEIEHLTNLCLPDYSIITNIGTSHIGYLKSKRNIFKAKMEILSGMSGGYLLLNNTDKYLKKVRSKKVEVVKVNNDAINVRYEVDKTSFDLNIDGKLYHFTFNIPGRHIMMDILLAIKVALMFKVPVEDIVKAVGEFEAYKGRLDVVKIDEMTIIDDCYNSSYESLMGSLSLLKKDDYNVVILGDILELGKKSEKIHKKINKRMKKMPINEVLLIGDETKVMDGIHFDSIDELQEYLDNHEKKGVFLIKASSAMDLGLISNHLKGKI